MKFKLAGKKEEETHEIYLIQYDDDVYVRCKTCGDIIAILDENGIYVYEGTCANKEKEKRFLRKKESE